MFYALLSSFSQRATAILGKLESDSNKHNYLTLAVAAGTSSFALSIFYE